jgi:hypothetical protein
MAQSSNSGLFYNSPVCRWHLEKFKSISINDWILYDDVNLFVRSTRPKNIAVLHWPYPNDPTFAELVNRIYDLSDQIFILISELHQPSVEFIKQFDRKKISFYVAGIVAETPNLAKLNYWMDWFVTSRHFYRDHLPEILHRIDYQNPKLMNFDILLGRKKLHRECIYNYVKANIDPGQYIMRYFNDPNQVSVGNNEAHWTAEKRGVKQIGPIEWTVDRVEYYGYSMSVSQIIPIEVYNKTAYTVVAETNWANNYTFFTEKTVKPIIARRLFLMVGGKGYLQALRSLGFKTFGDVIDESYDLIDDDLLRFDSVGRVIQWLCNQDQSKILQQIQHIVEHNFNHLMNRDWYNDFVTSFESEVQEIVQQAQN